MVVRRVPALNGATGLVDSAPASASTARIGTKRPISMATPPRVADSSVTP